MAVHSKQQRLMRGALLLTLAGLFGKVLSAGYRVPLQNIAGDIGFYIYQQVYPILGMAWMISIYGFPMAISSLVARAQARGGSLSVRRFYAPVFMVMIGVSLVLFSIFYFGSSAIASFMGDQRLRMPLRVTATVFLLLPFTSIGRGVFQGIDEMTPTAVSQMIEQVVRVLVIISATLFFVGNGYNYYYVGSGAAFGSILGGLAACLVLSFYITKHRSVLLKPSASFIPIGDIIRTMVLSGLFLCVNYMLLLLMQFADAFTMISSLKIYGLSLKEAQEMKGVFDRGYPLLQLGTVLASSLALAIVPSVTKKRLENKTTEVQENAGQAMKLSFLISIAASVGLFILMPEVNVLLFTSNEGVIALRVLSVAIVFASMTLTLSSLLQGFGIVFLPAFAVAIGVIVKVILNTVFTPALGITGSGLATLVSICVVFLSNIMVFKKRIPFSLRAYIPWRATFFSLVVMTVTIVVAGGAYSQFIEMQHRQDYVGYCFLTIALGALSYGVSLLKSGAFTDKELDYFPKSTKLKRLTKRRS
ncbi:polysaccharide biosynthesis protein [Pontibacillus chungwhensis BH030062]|uniref:Polysaccharide biosynthesis protein n=1 Tax=Pontibacillus chungwhensis BH030062 TaxID=1385513 RepID=A0A0A2UNS0_9BACI|nr:polysaccharide biosynthesis protein [Pontibacillus chungwhensis]KGP89907.1 polysaccharide biosynthesis protein [Pontibacillus chungwhensis BH030062]